MEDGEIVEDPAVSKDLKKGQSVEEENAGVAIEDQNDGKPYSLQQSGWSRRDGNQRAGRRVHVNLILFYWVVVFPPPNINNSFLL